MSATTPDPTSDVAGEARRQAATTTHTVSTSHARLRWYRRGDSSITVAEAWTDGHPVHYPSARNETVARWHAATDTILLASRDGEVVTVLRLTDRRPNEQRYVREQVRL